MSKVEICEFFATKKEAAAAAGLLPETSKDVSEIMMATFSLEPDERKAIRSAQKRGLIAVFLVAAAGAAIGLAFTWPFALAGVAAASAIVVAFYGHFADRNEERRRTAFRQQLKDLAVDRSQ
jgi:hypothetical protein